MMAEKIKGYIRKIFYWLFVIVFGILIWHLLTNNEAFHYSKWKLALLVLLSLVFLAAAYICIKKHEAWLERQYPIIMVLFLWAFAVIQLICAFRLRYETAYDMEAVYRGAVEWAETGSFSSYYEYYYFFPNNLGGMFFLYCFFLPAHKLGIQDYYEVAVLVNGLCVIAAMATTVTICRKILGVRHAVFAMILFVVSLPFYFMAAVFYTDSLSMLFPVLIYYLYLKVKESRHRKEQILFSLLLGVSAAIGMQIKFTVAITLIAVVIDSLLHESWKRTAAMAGIAAAVILAAFTCFQSIIYPRHLDKETARQNNTPYLHWVMMGLQGDGGYNPGDYVFTRSFADTDERDAAIREEIANRIDELGFTGMRKLVIRKMVKSFGSGTYCQSDFLDDRPVNETWLHDYILYEGVHYDAYQHVCHGVFLAILILMTISGIRELLPGQGKTACYLAPRLAVFGVLLFLTGWETNGRYFMNHVAIIFVAASMGIDSMIFPLRRHRD